MNNSSILVYGVGIKGDKYPTRQGRHLKEYQTWVNIFVRCFDEKYKVGNPSYNGCSVSDNFKSYTFFYEWCQTQVGFNTVDENRKTWHLDKDLLFKGNKVYSEDACVFLPQRVNMILTSCKAVRGDNPVGVIFHSRDKVFIARCQFKGKNKHLGTYRNKEDAFVAYKTFKEAYIKEVANEYRTQIDPRAYEALMNYEVNIYD